MIERGGCVWKADSDLGLWPKDLPTGFLPFTVECLKE